jgi:hypothetical protein
MIWRFKKATEGDPYTDDTDTTITAYWTTPLNNLGTYSYYKIVKNVIVTVEPNSRTSADILYNSDDSTDQLAASDSMALLDFDDIDFDDWSFATSAMPQVIATNTKERKIVFFGCKVFNDKLAESLGIYSIEIRYELSSPVK